MWVECMDIFKQSAVEGATKTVQRVTDECVKDLPEGAWDYWPLCSKDAAEWYPEVHDPTNAYCKDPCCNLDLQSSMCCMSKEVSYEVPAPTFDFAAFSDTCYVSDARAQLAGGASASVITESNPQNAMGPANKIFERLINPASCLTVTDTMATVVKAIEDDLTCCLTAVTGEWSWEKNRFLSTQPCNGAGDCLSGSCISTEENSNPDKQGTCWPARTAFTNACAVSSAADAGAAIAQCLDAKLLEREKNEVAYGAARTSMKVVLGGSLTATYAQVGATILEQAAYQTCEGPDGWKYNPDNTCQNYEWETGTCGEQFCETAEECKEMCLNQTACNWSPDVYESTEGGWNEWRRRTSDECLTGKSDEFCSMTNDWGWVEDVTVAGSCSYQGVVLKAPSWWDPDTLEWQWEHKNVTDAICSAIDTSMTAIESEWSWDGSKKCGYTTGTMASDKDQCLDACTGSTNGFQPPKIFSCYKTPVDGKCDTTGWFTQLRHNPTVDWSTWPWEIPFPQVCVADFWGPGGIYEQAEAVDPSGNAWSSDANTTAVWSITLTTTSPGTYDLRDAWDSTDAWAVNVAGHTEWWRGLSFTSQANADAVCDELSALVIVEDDGSQNCGENRCWLKTITSQSDCDDFSNTGTATAQADFGYAEWRSSYNAGNGACFARPTWGEGYDLWSDGTDALAKRKTLCGNLGGTYYVGRQYTEGKMDSADKCSGEYCSVLGPRFNADESLCDSIGGQCRNSEGCYGCRAPWYGEVSDFEPKEGLCYKAGVTSASNCSNSNTYVSDLKICVDSGAPSLSDCSDTWLTCDDIDPDDCKDTEAKAENATSVRKYVSASLKCRREKQQQYCTTKSQCEDESGTCWGPQLRNSICTHEEDNYACKIVDNACKVGVNETHPWMCAGSPACDDDWGCWDEERDFFGTYCVDYTIETEVACDTADGEWLGTDIASQKEFCLSDTECSGGNSAWGNVWERNEAECEKCGGEMYSWGEWNSGTWVVPSMIEGGREYKARAMEQVNKWSSQIDEWKVKDLIRDIQTQLNNDAQVSFALCMYGELGQYIEGLASECGGANATQKFESKNKMISSMKKTVNAGVAGTNADADGTSVTTTNETFTTSDGLQGTIELVIGTDNANPGASTAGSRRRRLAQGEATMDAAGCWSKVRNGNDVLIGQLLGDCAALEVSPNMVAKRFVKICLPTKTSREIATAYTEDAFAVRTTNAVSKEFVYTPATDLEVSADGTKLCAKITKFSTLYCPVKLASSWATASSDVGSANCEATNKLVDLQEESKSRAASTLVKDAAEDVALEKCASGGDCSAAESIATSGSDSGSDSVVGSPDSDSGSDSGSDSVVGSPDSDSGSDSGSDSVVGAPASAAAPTFSVFFTALMAVFATLFAGAPEH